MVGARWTSTANGRCRVVVAVLLLLLNMRAAVAEDDGRDELLRRIDVLWTRRDAHGAVPDMVTLGTLVLDIDPQSYDAQWRLARAYFWIAYTQPSRLQSKLLSTKAMEWGERARQNAPDRVEGHYFYTLAIANYASKISTMTAVSDGVAGKIETSAQRTYEIDPDFFHGAPGTVLGRYYFSLPWPLRDLQRSRQYLETVVNRHPESLVARYYLAETYHESGEDSLARAQLEYVLSHDPPDDTVLERPAPKPLAQEALRNWAPAGAEATDEH